jgi:hypothetical protein
MGLGDFIAEVVFGGIEGFLTKAAVRSAKGEKPLSGRISAPAPSPASVVVRGSGVTGRCRYRKLDDMRLS